MVEHDLFTVPPYRPPSQQERGEIGMEAAVEHAESVNTGWKEEAAEYLRRFAREAGERSFLAEEIAPWAYERGCRYPPDDRAWGAIIKAASKAKVIETTGLAAKNRLSGNNSTWRPLWRAVARP